MVWICGCFIYCPVVSFKYDPFGRRIYKSSSSATSAYAYDGDNLVEQTNATGGVVARYEETQNIDEPLAMLRSNATNYFHADGLGSITPLNNAAGSIANTYLHVRLIRQTNGLDWLAGESVPVHGPRIRLRNRVVLLPRQILRPQLRQILERRPKSFATIIPLRPSQRLSMAIRDR